MEAERTGDVVDRASLEEQRETAARIALARAKETAPVDWDKQTCYECGDGMPKERLAAGRFLCVPCKTLEEKKGKGY